MASAVRSARMYKSGMGRERRQWSDRRWINMDSRSEQLNRSGLALRRILCAPHRRDVKIIFVSIIMWVHSGKSAAGAQMVRRKEPVEPHATEVTIQTHGYYKYKRTLADVLLFDGTNVNHTLVKDGWCWWYREYAPGIRCWEGWSGRHEQRRTACGLTTSPCRRGSGGIGASWLLTRSEYSP